MIDFPEFVIGIAICAGNLGIEEMIKCASHSNEPLLAPYRPFDLKAPILTPVNVFEPPPSLLQALRLGWQWTHRQTRTFRYVTVCYDGKYYTGTERAPTKRSGRDDFDDGLPRSRQDHLQYVSSHLTSPLHFGPIPPQTLTQSVLRRLQRARGGATCPAVPLQPQPRRTQASLSQAQT